MPLWTTYLSLWARRKEDVLKVIGATSERHIAAILFVMRNRGNNEVAPDEYLLLDYKTGKISWEEYARRYTEQLQRNTDAEDWIYDRLVDLEDGGHVLLICFEKDAAKCHRRLLAEEMKRQHPEIDYRGEVNIAANIT